MLISSTCSWQYWVASWPDVEQTGTCTTLAGGLSEASAPDASLRAEIEAAPLPSLLEELERHHWLLGGEGSGHLLALDKHTTGDGLISALQVLQACVRSGRGMAGLLADLTLFPQTLINVRLAEGSDW